MKRKLLSTVCGLVLIAGCAPVIKTQSIPVSTNPMGATVYADGKIMCSSPCSVELARNAEHIITLKKEQYRQYDVIVKRVYQQEKVMLKAVSQGIQSSSYSVGSGTDKAAWGMMQGVNSIDSQEQTGDAYVLSPSAVSVRLIPLTPQAQHNIAGSTAPDIQSLTSNDRAQISYILETMKTGTDFDWINSQTGIKYFVKAGPIISGYDVPTRSFILRMTAFGQTTKYDAKASRVNNGEWSILGNGASSSMITDERSVEKRTEPAKMNSDSFLMDSVKAGTMAAPSIHGGVTAKGGSSSEGWDGNTYKKECTSTRIKAGVNVNPAQAVEVLDMITKDN